MPQFFKVKCHQTPQQLFAKRLKNFTPNYSKYVKLNALMRKIDTNKVGEPALLVSSLISQYVNDHSGSLLSSEPLLLLYITNLQSISYDRFFHGCVFFMLLFNFCFALFALLIILIYRKKQDTRSLSCQAN